MKSVKNLFFVFLAFVILIVAGSCPTPYLDLPIEDNYVDRMVKEYNAEIVAILEFENADFAKILTGDYASNPSWGTPEVHNSDNASGGRFVKEISYKHGRADLKVPNTVQAGSYIIVIGWSGSPSGVVTVTLNPETPDAVLWENIAYERSAAEWDMKDPQTLLITDNASLKPGDILRAHNGLDSFAPDPALNYIHLDALFILKAN